MDLINLLIFVIVVGMVCYIVQLLPMAQVFKNVALAIVLFIFVLYLLAGLPSFGHHLVIR